MPKPEDTAFVVDRKLLLSALLKVQNATPVRTPLAQLENIEFSFAKDMLSICGTDLDVYISTKIPCEATSALTFLVDGGQITKVVSTLCGDEVEFRVDTKQVFISSGATKSALRLSPGEMPSPYKNFATDDWVETRALSEMIKLALVSISPDYPELALGGCLLSVKDKQLGVTGATTRTVSFSCEEIEFDGAIDVIVPRKTSAMIVKIFGGDVNIGFGKGLIRFTDDSTELTCRLIAGEYTNLEPFLPKEFAQQFTTNRIAFIDTIRRVTAIGYENKLCCDFKLDLTKDSVHLSSVDIDSLSESEEAMSVDSSGADISVWMDAKQVLPLLTSLDSEDVQILFASERGLITIKPVGDEHITLHVMPKKH